MIKIAVNRCFGGFGLSMEAEDLYAKKSGFELFRYDRNGDYTTDDYVKVKNAKEGDWGIVTFTKDHGDAMTYDSTKEQGYWYYNDIKRDDPILIKVVEELGAKADGEYADLEIVEIPDDVDWSIEEYDGSETLAEKHRTW